MSNQLRKIRRNQSEMAGVGRCNRYGNESMSNNGSTFKRMKSEIKNFVSRIARNNYPENHRGNIQKTVQKSINEEIYS